MKICKERLRFRMRRILGLIGAVMLTQRAECFQYILNTIGGPVQINIAAVGANGSLVSPAPLTTPGFRPPSIFSAPLPSGSGARALGQAGAFTAVADDATAASWNPAGLIQLEYPEASVALRYSRINNKHQSGDDNFQVGANNYDELGLNYLSAVYPLRLGKRNVVFSLNYQEAYDFQQRFTASNLGKSFESSKQTSSRDISISDMQHVSNGSVDLDLSSHLTTHTSSYLNQIINATMLSSLDFRQQGVIDAITPSMAVELSPSFNIGAAFNVFQDNTLGNRPIHSSTRASYSGKSGSLASVRNVNSTVGSYAYTGVWHMPPQQVMPGVWSAPMDVPITGSGDYPPFSDIANSSRPTELQYDGVFSEENSIYNLRGFNATLGAMWAVTSQLTLGADVDLPWTAKATQRKVISNRITTYDASHQRVLDVSDTLTTEQKGITIDFPFYWALGASWKWNNVFSSAIDVSQTQWSKFSYQADGEERINPLDGSKYGENPLKDCWAVRVGSEYLWVLSKTEIPFRAGVAWEQRPAIGSPDVFKGFSLGTGISIGHEPNKLILDISYSYMRGNNVLRSLVPSVNNLSTDSIEQSIFVSGIWHF